MPLLALQNVSLTLTLMRVSKSILMRLVDRIRGLPEPSSHMERDNLANQSDADAIGYVYMPLAVLDDCINVLSNSHLQCNHARLHFDLLQPERLSLPHT